MSVSDASRPTLQPLRSLPHYAVETHCFAIRAATQPGILPRILELFAKRNLVPTKWHSAVFGLNGEDLQVDIQMEGIEAELASYIARCLRQIYGVDSVLTSTKTAG
ncbi:MAG: hypothetical protein R3D05_22080 [Dongiaceae bacterium]